MVLTLDREAHSTRHNIYIDNVGVHGSYRRVVAQRMGEVCLFDSKGLEVHEQELRSEGIEALGVVLDGRRRCTSLSVKRFR